MMAAIAAAYGKMDTLIIEKSEYYGGSTSLSGGSIWVPNNLYMKAEGVDDSDGEAALYLAAIAEGKSSFARQRAYLENAKEMVCFLQQNCIVHFSRCPGYADYFPHLWGANTSSRSLEPIPFDGKRLGIELLCQNPPLWQAPFGLSLTAKEYRLINLYKRSREGKKALFSVISRALADALFCRKTLTLGQSLIGQMRLELLKKNVPLWLKTPFLSFIHDKRGRLVGIKAINGGKTILIGATRGILIASGGFAQNEVMRKRYQLPPIGTAWTNAHPHDTGDLIQAAMAIGAKIDLMDEAWWGPCSILPDGKPFFHVAERSLPGAIIINGVGQRYCNEAAPYTEFVHKMYDNHQQTGKTIPSFFIMDHRFRKNYPFGMIPPGFTPRNYLTTGYIIKANNLRELAEKIDVDARALLLTIERFNVFARKGEDPDFHKGQNVYDRYYGDPTVLPNPCIAPIELPPYYAVKLFPGDLGTKGGLVTDENSRVLGDDDQPIPHLYATGNSTASIMGHSYAGAGATIGPAMVFGWIAAHHAMKR